MIKATHSGTCQCCGNFQKLPGGRLSKHGYTKQWGFFEGICPGTGELPYELSCELIKGYIANAQRRLEGVLTKIAVLRSPATEAKGWYRDYDRNPASRRGYFWRQADIQVETKTYSDGDGTYTVLHVLDEKGVCIPNGQTGLYPPHGLKTVEEFATFMNSKKADSLEREDVAQLKNYISWQTRRVNDWKLTALFPVKAEPVAS